MSNFGPLYVSIDGKLDIVVRGNEKILDLCFELLDEINLKLINDNDLERSWRGSITVTVNGTARGLDCDGCTGLPFDNWIVIGAGTGKDGPYTGERTEHYRKHSYVLSTFCQKGDVCTLIKDILSCIFQFIFF